MQGRQAADLLGDRCPAVNSFFLLLASALTALAHAVGILLVAVGVYLCYRYAHRILRKLGPTGTSVVVRLTAFILLCIGVQICWNGVHGIIATGFPSSVS
jgi:multiple antibiotic resistance protein